MLKYYFLAYFILTTIFYILIYRRQNENRQKIISEIERSILSGYIRDETIDKIKKIEEIKKICSPWYEKLVSVIGVSAFISMSFASLFQTYEIYKKEREKQEIEKKINLMKYEEVNINKYLDLSVSYIIENYHRNLEIGKRESEILKWKASRYISQGVTIDNDNLRMLFSILIATKQFDVASEIINNNKNKIEDIIKSANMADNIAFSEYYYVIGENDMARKFVNNSNSDNLNPSLAKRFFTMLWILNKKEPTIIDKLKHKLGGKYSIDQLRKEMEIYNDSLDKMKEKMI